MNTGINYDGDTEIKNRSYRIAGVESEKESLLNNQPRNISYIKAVSMGVGRIISYLPIHHRSVLRNIRKRQPYR